MGSGKRASGQAGKRGRMGFVTALWRRSCSGDFGLVLPFQILWQSQAGSAAYQRHSGYAAGQVGGRRYFAVGGGWRHWRVGGGTGGGCSRCDAVVIRLVAVGGASIHLSRRLLTHPRVPDTAC